MPESQLVFRCPYCDEPFEATPPDRLHTAFSFEEPLMASFHDEVKRQTIICKNPECKKPIVIYWYAPMEYFARI
jgi:hypothetical protein